MNKKSTKRALLSSILSLVLCITMLIGTTFAWFTDSVTSSNNIIKSGKLDVELNYKEKLADAWKDASQGAIFDYDKWEPGYVDVKYVQVANVGNLTFKYLLNIIPEVLPVEGEVNLADVIDVYVIKNPTKDIVREDLATMTKVGTLASLMADTDGAARGILLPEGADINAETLTDEERAVTEVGSVTMGIALKMQETAGNEYQDLSVGEGFTVELLATQYMYEADSFDDTYDEMADFDGEIGGIASLIAAFQTGGTYKLINDIAVDETVYVAKGVAVTLDLNGQNINYNGTSGSVIYSEGDLTLVGEGEINTTASSYALRAQRGSVTIDSSDIAVVATFGAISMFNGAEVTINGGSYTATGAAGKTHHCIYVGSGANLVVNGGTFTHNGAGTSDSGATLTVYAGANGGATVNGGTFIGSGTYIRAFDKYDSSCYLVFNGGTFSTNPSNYVAEGCTAVQNADGTYTVVNGKGVSTQAELQTALDNAVDGDIINLTADITGNVVVTQKSGVDVVINGQGRKFTGVMTVFGAGRQTGAETLTIKNIDFVAVNGADSCILSPDKAVNNAYSYSHNVTVENCTFTDPDGTVDCAAIRHGDGGDMNWTVKNCTVDATMHSIFQVNNVAGKLLVEGCTVSSKNGANLNSCTNVEITGCTFNVKGYAVRFGVKTGGNLGTAKNYLIKNSTLKSACDDGDAVIMFRASAVDAVLTLENTTLIGTTEISGNTSATTINR